ncbi:hypothetical protein SprV_0200790900 [Sparganum proliferum]
MLSSVLAAPQFQRKFDFLTDITPATILTVAFREELSAYTNDGREIGYYKCSIENDGCRAIHVLEKSEYTYGKVNYSTELSAELNFKLIVTSETYKEMQKKPDGYSESVCNVRQELDMFEIETTTKNNDRVNKTTQVLKKDELPMFLSHGGSLVFQRLLITTITERSIEVCGLDDLGNLCEFTYDYLGEKITTFDDSQLSAFGIQLSIPLPDGTKRTWQKYFTMDGQLLSQEQVGLPVAFRVKKTPAPIIHDTFLPRPANKEINFCWEDNMELFSKFLERKDELKSEYHLYFYDHPEFVDIVKDFLQCILIDKPEDVLNYAADFFTTTTKRIRISRSRPSCPRYHRNFRSRFGFVIYLGHQRNEYLTTPTAASTTAPIVILSPTPTTISLATDDPTPVAPSLSITAMSTILATTSATTATTTTPTQATGLNTHDVSSTTTLTIPAPDTRDVDSVPTCPHCDQQIHFRHRPGRSLANLSHCDRYTRASRPYTRFPRPPSNSALSTNLHSQHGLIRSHGPP